MNMNEQTINSEKQIPELEMPSRGRLNHLSAYLLEFYSRATTANAARVKHAYELVDRVRERLAPSHNVQVRICGSMWYGVCTSDTQCDVSIEPVGAAAAATQPETERVLRQVAEIVRTDMTDLLKPLTEADRLVKTIATGNAASFDRANRHSFRSVDAPAVVVNFISGVYPSAYQTASLLRAYLDLDERARVLAFCFRHMAKVNIYHTAKSRPLLPQN